MRSRIAMAAVLGTALALPACGNPLGINTPVCDRSSSALILSAQALPGTAFVPCINSLKTDWVYDDLRAERGRSEFGLGSLSMGMFFLRVTLQPTCDTSSGDAGRRATSPVRRSSSTSRATTRCEIVVVPDDEGAEVSRYAASLVQEARRHRARRPDRWSSTSTPAPRRSRRRIETARQAGATVLARHRPRLGGEDRHDHPPRRGHRTQRRGDGRHHRHPARHHRGRRPTPGSWYYPFRNGCVTYTFDAHGSGVATIEDDVKAALGLYDAEAMRQAGPGRRVRRAMTTSRAPLEWPRGGWERCARTSRRPAHGRRRHASVEKVSSAGSGGAESVHHDRLRRQTT